MWWIYVLVGLICGFVDSVLGMGYGVSAATVLVSFGLAPALVSASIHTAEGFVDIVSGLSHWKFDNVDKTLFLHLMIPGVAGAVIGALFLSWISAAFAKKFVAVLLFMMGLTIFLRFIQSDLSIHKRIPTCFVPLLGFVAGVVDVTGGGGWRNR